LNVNMKNGAPMVVSDFYWFILSYRRYLGSVFTL
jgi:hypothetical protein